MTPEQVNEKYEPRVRVVLAEIATALREDGWLTGPICDMCDDEYSYALLVSRYDADPSDLLDDDVDIKFELLESEHCDGSEDGLSFAISVHTVGGEIVGGLSPYNYTTDVWVPRDDVDAIERRFAILEQADVGELVCLLEDRKEYEGPE